MLLESWSPGGLDSLRYVMICQTAGFMCYGIYGCCTVLVATAIIVSQPSTLKLFGGFQSQTISAMSALNVHRQKITEKHKKDMLDERDQKTKLFIKLKELQVELWSLGVTLGTDSMGVISCYIMYQYVI